MINFKISIINNFISPESLVVLRFFPTNYGIRYNFGLLDKPAHKPVVIRINLY